MMEIGKAEKRLGIDLETYDKVDFLADYYNIEKKEVMYYAVDDMYSYIVEQDERYNIGDSE